MKIKIKYFILILFLLIKPLVSYSQNQGEVTLKKLLEEMINTKEVAHWPNPFYNEFQASSYDRRSISPNKPGWFANHDFSEYIHSETQSGHNEQVMLDVNGPGAIVRFWLTTGPKRDGILRIYFDNKKNASIIINSYDLMKSGLPLVIPHSSYQSKGRGGSTLYFPLPYAKHCKITWEEQNTTSEEPRYYQINYRTYTQGTKVETFNPKQLYSLKNLIHHVQQVLWNPPINTIGTKVSMNRIIAPGKEASLRLPKGASAITLLSIKSSVASKKEYAQILRSTILKITFDGHQTVWCPIGDFSGSGVGGKPVHSWYRTVTNKGEIISRWVMPYKTKATISLLNLSNIPVTILLATNVEKWNWTNRSMYFHTSWKMARNIQITKWDTTGAAEWNLITIKGKGVYLGNTLSVFNYMHTWYGEGDPKIWVDTASFPVEFGTGLEDYYNTSWAPVVIYQTPFANVPRADNVSSYGYNTFTRTCNLDRIPFNSYFRMDWEMLGWKTGKANIAATIYWYGFENASDNSKRMKKKATMLLPKEINR